MDSERKIVTLETDLLVLGTGAAGCGAALAARRAGIRTLMVDKGKLESSGCLGGGNDHFLAVLGTNDPDDTVDDLVRFYLKPCSGFSESMLRGWGRTMPLMVNFLEGLGVKLLHRADGGYLRTAGRGEPAWHINIAEGQRIKRLVAGHLRSLGTDVLDHVMITRLLVRDGRAAGAVGYNVLDGTCYVISAAAVIMALGNSCNRATANSTGNPYNTWHSPFNTGSQYVLAYEAGATIINMDLKQQATLVPKGFGCAGMNGINGAGAHELNALGERFMPKYHPQMENCPRQFQIGGTYQEQIEGNGPPFVMEMRHIDAESLHHLQYVLMPGDKATFLDYCAQRGVDFAKAPMEVEIGEIEFSGMLATDDAFMSSLPGLYNGCVFYTFSGSMCSGYLAGESAAANLGKAPGLKGLEDEIGRECERIFTPLTPLEDAVPQAMFESSVRQVMSYYMGFVRNEKGIDVALDRLAFLSGYADKVRAGNMHELMMTHEALHLLESCRLSTLCTRERKESGRSIYRRSDYPEKDPAYEKILAVRKGTAGPEVFWLQ
ncbi:MULTISPECIES: FAD-binding protein [Desulfovibrio]|uniref:FAD-binding protein n=1 Tax=Desulfovibrio TaxID=872 RepID=UPI00265D01DB|nr:MULTISPECIES: FAD-binding protein [Desulfovibrio]MCI7617218.1 FAD-binding protein [Desulfovibrio piger]MDY4806241.1 FAD-binding protein [Desulfovibrio sp.]